MPAAVLPALVYSAVTGVSRPQVMVWSDATPGSRPLRPMRGSATSLQQEMEMAVVDGAYDHYNWVVPADLLTTWTRSPAGTVSRLSRANSRTQ